MSTELKIEILDPEADDKELNELTESLRQDLLALDVDSVSRPRLAPAPEGSKGLDVAAVGAILVALKSSVDVATQVVSAVRSWMHRTKGSTQTLKLTMNGQTLELSSATVDQQQQLLDAFVAAAATSKQV